MTLKREPLVVVRVGLVVAWSADIAVIGGGIAEASPAEQFCRAPERGYVTNVEYSRSEQKRGVSARSFYIKTADGEFGRIELDPYGDDEGPTARCVIKAYLNPTGSRNLEYNEIKSH